MSIQSTRSAQMSQADRSEKSDYKALVKFLLLAALEVAMAALWFIGLFPLTVAIIAHALILVLMAYVWSRAAPRDLLLIPVGFIAVLFAGPLGAFGVLLLSLLTSFSKQDRDQLGDWYDRLQKSTFRDRETIRYQSIKGGRARSVAPGDTMNFKQIFLTGSAKDKQSVLAIIALKYIPEFYPVLQIALRDDEPTIRVQAAATFAKLRMKFKTRLLSVLPDNEEATLQTGSTGQRITTVHACVCSQFLDQGELSQAHEAVKSLYDKLLPAQQEVQLELVLCDTLIAEQAYDEVIDRLKPLLDKGEANVRTPYHKALHLAHRYDELVQSQNKVLIN